MVTALVTVSGETANVEVCENGSIAFTGSGNSASFSGSFTCPDAYSLSGDFTCSTITVVFTSGTATLSNGTLTVTTNGTASGCNASYSITQTQTGTM